MREEMNYAQTAQKSARPVDRDDLASYEDGDHLVVCDKMNTNAWIASDAHVDIER